MKTRYENMVHQYLTRADGGRAGYMGGGITGIRKPNAIAPTGGPMSQGLRSLYNNDRNYARSINGRYR